MAHAILFDIPGMNRDIYDRTLGAIDEAGKDHIHSRSVHVAYLTPAGLSVLDVWDSMDEFEAFGQTLMPILAAEGLDMGAVEPRICKLHNKIVL